MLKRLLLLTFEFPPHPGGIGTYAYQMASQLSAHDIDVTVLATRGKASPQAISQHDAELPYRVKRYPDLRPRPLSLLNRFRVAMDECRRFDPDLVLVCNYGSTHIAGVLSARFGVEYVVAGMGSEFLSHYRGIERSAYTRLLKNARGCLAISRYTRGLMCDFLGSSESSIPVITLGADSEVFRATGTDRSQVLRRKYGLEDETVLLTVGRLSERKGQDVAIRAVAQLASRYPELHYVIVGQGPSRESQSRLATELGVQDRVHFAGFVAASDLPGYYEMADLFVLPSRATANGEVEGFGIVICEANLMGIPAVGTSGSGIEDTMVDGVTGFLVKPDSVASLASGIEALVADTSFRHRMGEAAREHAAAKHTWQRTGENTLDYLRSCA